MPKIRPIYAQDIPKICPRYAQNMTLICPWYAQDMPQICSRYVQDMLKLCSRYAQDIPFHYRFIPIDIVVDMAKSMTVWVNIWHVAYFGPVVYLGKSMTRGSLFGQSYDMLLTFTLLYSWTNLWHLTNYLAKENQVWCQYCSCLFPLWSCAHP